MKYLSFVILFILLSFNAFGAQPYFELEVGHQKTKEELGTSPAVDLVGIYGRFRLGVRMESLIFGASWGQGGLEGGNEGPLHLTYNNKDIGAFVGYNSSPGFRAIFSLFAKSELEIDSIDGTDGSILQTLLLSGINGGAVFSGIGFGVQLGYEIVPHIALNVEYRKLSYDKFQDIFGREINGIDAGGSVLFLSLSIPAYPLTAGD